MKITISPDIKADIVYHVRFEFTMKTKQIREYDTAYSIRNSELRLRAVIKRCKLTLSKIESVFIYPIRELSKIVK